ncbi:MAG: putative DNA binding domain-containing protein [Anaerolineae bacterium]|nr:putative DNA binding domain-containing protein [Anaerolineae bacterium]
MLTPGSIQRGPGPLLELLPQPEPAQLAETLVAFANTDGGTILIGLDEDGAPVGDIFDEDIEGILHVAERYCRPPVVVGWESFETKGGTVIAIKVHRSPELHALDDGRVLIRAGAENRPLSGEEIRHLAATKSAGDFETENMPGATFDDLNPDIIDEYLAMREQRARRDYDGPVQSLLTEAGALTEDGAPTVTGMLLFGKRPQAWLPQSSVVFVKFSGTEPRSADGQAGYGRREEVTGPLARVIEHTWDLIWSEMAVSAVVTGLKREERPEYPQFAVREAVVNAVCHRDYRLRGRRVEVRMYADRLEVHSPGGLPGYITVDNLIEEHFSRNPRIVAGLFQWGFIEELGLGIDRMVEEMVQDGHPPPKFVAKPYSFTVTLFNVRERPAVTVRQGTMNERQMLAVNYIRDHGAITNREFRQLCPDVSAETLRLDLADLTKQGILLKIGSKRGTYYILK